MLCMGSDKRVHQTEFENQNIFIRPDQCRHYDCLKSLQCIKICQIFIYTDRKEFRVGFKLYL